MKIRSFTEDDITSALRLCRNAGWNQLHEDWSRLVAYERNGCFVAEQDGQVVATITTTCYGQDLAWIGMMLVDERFRRRGVATALMETSLAYLQNRGALTIKLDATPAGQLVYERLGFEPEGVFHRWSRDSDTLPSWNSLATTETLTQTNFELDRTAFAANRSAWLQRLAECSRIVTCDASFAMARRGFLANYLGPVVAEDSGTANKLIVELLGQLRGHTFWDIPPDNPSAYDLAQSLGFQPARDLVRMRIGSSTTAPSMEYQFAISDPSSG